MIKHLPTDVGRRFNFSCQLLKPRCCFLTNINTAMLSFIYYLSNFQWLWKLSILLWHTWYSQGPRNLRWILWLSLYIPFSLTVGRNHHQAASPNRGQAITHLVLNLLGFATLSACERTQASNNFIPKDPGTAWLLENSFSTPQLFVLLLHLTWYVWHGPHSSYTLRIFD